MGTLIEFDTRWGAAGGTGDDDEEGDDDGDVDPEEDDDDDDLFDAFGRRCFPSRVPMKRMTGEIGLVVIPKVVDISGLSERLRLVIADKCVEVVVVPVMGKEVAIRRAPHITMDRERITNE